MTGRVDIAERMEDRAQLELAHNNLVGCQVKLHLRHRRRREWTPVADPSHDRWLAALVPTNPEGGVVDLELQSTRIHQPLADLTERRAQSIWIEVLDSNREVEIFGEPIGLEPALP